ncbi:DUF6278 family protein [Streptomyces sp. NRRL B-24484]|uniref:DUF6278 family protein n=1 Tax=Streptomyces sp. NRRL B-24484 TaxID=1463833 RepID=UPI0004C0EFCB|nr:DUF6278 family protein [Streptomyces sp. NRRL B-24484]
MGIGFLDRWRARHAHHPGGIPQQPDEPAMADLLAECGLLRELADDSGVRLDDGVTSLTQLDQLLPRWRDDPEVSEWLGNDAGLYLGTVLRRSVPGTVWRIDERDRPLLVLPGGRELDVTAIGHSWAVEGSPQLAAAYLAATDG